MGRLSNAISTLVAALFLLETIKHCQCENSTTSCVQEEGEALLKFKQSLINISRSLHTWKGKDCCQWKGVFCDNTGHVVKLDLRGNSSSHDQPAVLEILEVTSCLLNLKHLTYLDLSNHNFQRTIIPKFFGSMKSLAYLNLSNANFSGEVPYHLGNLTALQVLDLSDEAGDLLLYVNDVNWISNLSSLHYLDLSGVQFRGTRNLMQVLNSLPSLTHLALSYCGLSYSDIPNGPVNSTHLATLQFLDLSYNNFYRGPIPIALMNMTSLRVLALSENYFGSQIPPWLGNFKSLVHLNLSLHEFDGQFSQKLSGCFGHALETLDLSYNNIGGALPRWLGDLKYLKYLHLKGNAFYGQIPSSLGKLSKLTDLVLSNNQLNGTIPDSLGQLLNLRVLDVSYNSLDGIISQVPLGNLSFLKELSISHTHLTIESKSNWIPPFQLERIEMAAIKIGPQFPQWLQVQRQVIKLDLSNTSLWGTIPNWIMHNHLITHLNLSNNQITGPPLKSIVNTVPNVENLILCNNLVNGSIPSSLCNTKSLQYLDLSNNKLSGSIPDCWKDTQKDLSDIKLSSNNLSGTIPSSIGRLLGLQFLSLSNNNLSGGIPLAMRNCTNLNLLDLSENKLSGQIPDISINFLEILNLRENMFHGRIPSQLCQLQYLRILDLAYNNLTGRISPCFGQLNGMSFFFYSNIVWEFEKLTQVIKGSELVYTKNLPFFVNMDLSCNNLVGEIPQELTLSALQGLNLSNNHLSGNISKSIGELKSLESLDLSSNRLSGTIPDDISELNFLSYFNVSYNNLSGVIPKGNQIQTLDNPTFYDGNPYLCVAPLLNKRCGEYVQHDGPSEENEDEEEDKLEKLWFYIVILTGFAFGFWGVIGTLLFKKSWRRAYFQYVEETTDKMYVAIVVKWARLKNNIWK
ncbi:LRR receptor-like kinase [Quillaja saponaria]|uniref:LRR receptor-like kinase n=1 Tax=Quillaja saponaria TaxID=32244 RepID=A0AAD7L1M0_QUISA|nr:LRR receptor-like kinase [Quillaja saponaria]